ncbi:MAG: FecR family protein [Fibrobacter sp.]|nr:FecR family protein [Fibrobacter sp.]
MKFQYLALSFALLSLVACKDDSAKVQGKLAEKPVSGTTAERVSVAKNSKPVSVDTSAESLAIPSEEDPSLIRAKVSKVVGEGEITRGYEYDWKPIRQGQKVVENDHVRTSVESEVTITAFDGTVLSIFENTSVIITAELLGTSNKIFRINIDKGNILFDVQKQKKDQFIFKTGSATASIRGTAGFVGNVNGQMVASLKEGEVEVTGADGKSVNIVQNQTILVDEKGGSKKLNLASSGTKALTAALSSIAAKPDAAKDLERALSTFDNDYSVRKQKFEKNLKFQTKELEKTIYEPAVTLSAQTNPGVIVTVLGETDTVGTDGIYNRTFSWDAKSDGTKRFLAICSDGMVEVPCHIWSTNYVDTTAVVDTASTDSSAAVEEPKQEVVKPHVKIDGPRVEKIHLPPPSVNYFGNFKFRLKGIEAADLKNVASIELHRSGYVLEKIPVENLVNMSFERQIQLERNKIVYLDVVVTMKNGDVVRARKTYEVFCYTDNHDEYVKVDPVLTEEQEYEKVKSEAILEEE